MQRVNEADFTKEVLEADTVVIADFYSDSCIPCKHVGIELSELDEEREDVKIVKINVNFDKPLAEKYGITATPTLIYFKGGEEKQRVTGRKSKKDIVAVLAELG